MPCNLRIGESLRVQMARKDALDKLIKALKEKKARILREGNKVSIEGWQERGGWCDACAIHALRLKGDFIIRQMVAEVVKETETVTYGHGH